MAHDTRYKSGDTNNGTLKEDLVARIEGLLNATFSEKLFHALQRVNGDELKELTRAIIERNRSHGV